MRLLITLLALFPAVADVAAAPARLARPVEEFQVVFLEGDDRTSVRGAGPDDATIDIGRVVAGRCAPHRCFSTVVRRRFRVRVDGRSTSARFARMLAFVQNEMPGQRVRINGRLLTSAPLLIDPSAPLGVPVAHTLEIEVSTAEPEGLLAQNIVWLAEAAR
jgi:hypothetical protein